MSIVLLPLSTLFSLGGGREATWFMRKSVENKRDSWILVCENINKSRIQMHKKHLILSRLVCNCKPHNMKIEYNFDK